MVSIDLPLEELWRYEPSPNREPDFYEFWRATLDELAAVDAAPDYESLATPFEDFETARVRFMSLGGGTVAGWLLRRKATGLLPGLGVFHGYGGRALRPVELLPYAAAGFAVLSIDCRGQLGDTDDVTSGPHTPGWLTSGIADPCAYYYRYVYADVVRSLEVLACLDGVDASCVAVTGGSQGGGLSLAAAALSPLPRFVWADVPFLCDFRRSVLLAERRPYTEISDFLRARPEFGEVAFRTLSYFDVVNLAEGITAEAIISVSLWDDVCPPSSIFAAFRHLASSEKRLEILPYHRHELSYELQEQRFAELVRFARKA